METDTSPGETNAPDSPWDDDQQIDRLARRAVQDALQEHKRKGQSVVVWQGGQIVTLTPNEIPQAPAADEVP